MSIDTIDAELEERIRVALQEMIPKVVHHTRATVAGPAIRSPRRRQRVLSLGSGALVAAAVIGLVIIARRDTDGGSPANGVDASPTITNAAGDSVQVAVAPTFLPADLHLTDVASVPGAAANAQPERVLLARRGADGELTGFVSVTTGAKNDVWRSNPGRDADGATYTFTPVALPDGAAELAVSAPDSGNETVLQYERGDTAVVISIVDGTGGADTVALLEVLATLIDPTQDPVAIDETRLPSGYEVVTRSTRDAFGPRTVLVYDASGAGGRSLTIDMLTDPTADAEYVANAGTTRVHPVRGHDGLYNEQPARPIDGLDERSLAWYERADLLIRVHATGLTLGELTAIVGGLVPVVPDQYDRLPPLALSYYLDDERYSPEQKDLIRDGAVSRDELVTAAAAYKSCMIAEVGGGPELEFDETGHYTLAGSIPAGVELAAYRTAEDACEIANFEAASLVYAYNLQGRS